jgi:hypothetical protein
VKGAQECVLADVLGVFRTDDARRNAEHDAAVALHELLESGQLTLQGALDQGLVRLGALWLQQHPSS